MPTSSTVELNKRLRDLITGEIHIGRLEPGDRLPSYRELAKRWGVDHRRVAAAYRALEGEGLVEIRGRSGVYLREQEPIGGWVLPDTARWVAEEVVTEAWRRGIRVRDLPEFIRRCTMHRPLRCVCLESTMDHRRRLCHEVQEWFGLEAVPLPVDALPDAAGSAGRHPTDRAALPEPLRGADLLVTTSHHAGQVRGLAERAGLPLVVVKLHPSAVAALERPLRAGRVTVVCVDPAFGERVRTLFTGEAADRVRVVLADDGAAVSALPPDEPVVATLAARERVPALSSPLLGPQVPLLSPESALEISRLIIRFNLESRGTDGS